MEPITQPQTLQYLTNAQGDRLGVVLSWETYTQLFQSLTMQADPEYLIGLSESELQALAHCKLAPSEQQHLDDLLDRQTQNALSPEALQQLDQLLLHIDNLTLLKTRARYTLHAITQVSLP